RRNEQERRRPKSCRLDKGSGVEANSYPFFRKRRRLNGRSSRRRRARVAQHGQGSDLLSRGSWVQIPPRAISCDPIAAIAINKYHVRNMVVRPGEGSHGSNEDNSRGGS